eukprot:TRINITY_DN12384_c0_g1_i1.p1 TRINITY_DN12384_c0_g1~~TRINITY_DN12384_c0_g1_i1.p1  ORF type:complete len:253 (-),score=12.91 TRINITY_DN12384_c0_g1_i1:847-1605(-)
MLMLVIDPVGSQRTHPQAVVAKDEYPSAHPVTLSDHTNSHKPTTYATKWKNITMNHTPQPGLAEKEYNKEADEERDKPEGRAPPNLRRLFLPTPQCGPGDEKHLLSRRKPSREEAGRDRERMRVTVEHEGEHMSHIPPLPPTATPTATHRRSKSIIRPSLARTLDAPHCVVFCRPGANAGLTVRRVPPSPSCCAIQIRRAGADQKANPISCFSTPTTEPCLDDAAPRWWGNQSNSHPLPQRAGRSTNGGTPP